MSLHIEPTPVANGWDDKGKRIVETWWSARYVPTLQPRAEVSTRSEASTPACGGTCTEVVTNCPLKSALLAIHYAREVPAQPVEDGGFRVATTASACGERA